MHMHVQAALDVSAGVSALPAEFQAWLTRVALVRCVSADHCVGLTWVQAQSCVRGHPQRCTKRLAPGRLAETMALDTVEQGQASKLTQ